MRNMISGYSTRALPGVLLATLLAGCDDLDLGGPEVKASQLREREGLYYLSDATAPFSGKATAHYPNGQMERTVPFRKGVLHGQFQSWYESGQPMEMTRFSNGLKEGSSSIWNEDGQKIQEAEFSDDWPSGGFSLWYEDGALRETMTAMDAAGVQQFAQYQADGQMTGLTHYQNRQPHGLSCTWNGDGSPESEQTFDTGEIVAARQACVPGEETPCLEAVHHRCLQLKVGYPGQDSVPGSGQ